MEVTQQNQVPATPPPQIQQSSSPSVPTTQPKRSPRLLWVITGVICFTLLAFVSFYFIQKAQAATISGIINFTALKPDPEDRGDVFIKYRKYGRTDAYKLANAKPPLKDDAVWNWTDAKSGQPYEVVAELVIDGQVVTTSEPLVVTAPAINQVLPLRVTWHNLPASVVSEEDADVQGLVEINGLIPAGSTLTIFARETNKTTFQSIGVIDNPKQQNTWEWTGSKPLVDYRMKAVMMNKGVMIGESDELVAAGGDSEINFVMNSQAQPPVTPTPRPTAPIQIIQVTPTITPTPAPSKGTISGKIVINGPKDKNTSVLVLWRKPGEGDYAVITRINYPNADGQTWQWTDAPLNQQYEITTALQVNETNIASSRSEIIVAPAENVDFMLNSGVQVQTPSDTPRLESCNNAGNNQSDATLVFSKVDNAGNYWLQVGTNPGANDINSTKQKAEGDPAEKRLTVRIDNNRSYYTNYAYSLCVNCSSDSNFSNFSNATRFWCGTDPNPGIDNKGYRCNTQSGLCEATRDTNAPYSYSNEGLSQCQRDCRIQPSPR